MAETLDILLVDSDSGRRGLFLSALSEAGYAVGTADSLEAARNLVSEAKDALLVTHLMLSDGNAFELAADWAAMGRVAIGLTDVFVGTTNRQYLRSRLGLTALLEHPIEPEEFLRRLDELPIRARTAVTGDVPVVSTPESPPTVPNSLDPKVVPLSGNLDDHDVVAVLTHLIVSRANGALMLQAERIKKLVYFEDGVPVGIKSNMTEEFLGQMLVREGVIHPDACEQSVQEMRASGRRQGEIFVAMGCLGQAQLEQSLHRQFLMKFEEIIAWDSGVYKYKDCAIPTAYQCVIPGDPAQLLWYGIERIRPIERAKHRLWPVMSFRLEWLGEGLDVNGLPYPDYAAGLFERLTGEHTAAALIEDLPDPDHGLLLVYALTAFGSLTYQTAQA